MKLYKIKTGGGDVSDTFLSNKSTNTTYGISNSESRTIGSTSNGSGWYGYYLYDNYRGIRPQFTSGKYYLEIYNYAGFDSSTYTTTSSLPLNQEIDINFSFNSSGSDVLKRIRLKNNGSASIEYPQNNYAAATPYNNISYMFYEGKTLGIAIDIDNKKNMYEHR